MTATATPPRSVEPRSNDHVLELVRDRLLRAGPQGEDTVTPAYNSFDAGVGDAVAAIVAPYWNDRDQAYDRWLTELQGSMREEAIDAAIRAMADELQLWLAARADVELAGR